MRTSVLHLASAAFAAVGILACLVAALSFSGTAFADEPFPGHCQCTGMYSCDTVGLTNCPGGGSCEQFCNCFNLQAICSPF